jgi:hypothetical protein
VKYDRKRLYGRWSVGRKAKSSSSLYRRNGYKLSKTVVKGKSGIRGKPEFASKTSDS